MNSIYRFKKLAVAAVSIFAIFLSGCDQNLPETEIHEIKLAGLASERFVEASGLAWYKDYLLILPQYPHKVSEEKDGALLKIKKQLILDYLESGKGDSISAELVPFSAKGLDGIGKKDGAGYEAIAFNQDKVFLAIESFDDENHSGYLISGDVYGDLDSIVIDSNNVFPIKSNSGIKNAGEETIVFFDNHLTGIHEANGKNNSKNLVANSLDVKSNSVKTIQFPVIEYRITDASEADEAGNFWVINYYYPGDSLAYKPAEDYYLSEYGSGITNLQFKPVERLLKLRIVGDRITRTEEPPVYLKLNENKGRNWEGLVKLDNKGFLLITDYYPRTLLAFVPHKLD